MSDAAPPSPTFFFDNCISKKLAAAMRDLGANVTHLQDEGFKPNEKDPVWITDVARRGWVIITADKRILSRPHEVAALRAGRATAFFMPKKLVDMQRWEQASWMMAAWPAIEAAAAKAKPGQCFTVAENRKVHPITE